MYKFLLCLKYLRTRFLAFVCIVSVMLGVATLVVVNSVMAGFSNKLKDRFHGLTSDMVIESPSNSGFPEDTDAMLAKIRNSPAAEHIEAIAPTIEVFGIVTYEVLINGVPEQVIVPVRVAGVDPKGRAAVGGFDEYLQQPERKKNPSFELSPDALSRWQRSNAKVPDLPAPAPLPGEPPAPKGPPADPVAPVGVIPGYGITHYRYTDPQTKKPMEKDILPPGSTVKIATLGAGKTDMEPVYSNFVVVDSIKTEMTEYDARYVYVPLDYLQRLRAMGNRVTHIQIKLKKGHYEKAQEVKAELQKLFPDQYAYQINTWEEKQDSLLKAVEIERGLLNLLLFMIVGVAGFCILAIFSTIVREKTRDIGILKSLGASNRGVMQIFLAYGLLLGLIGAGLGTILGLIITFNINPIEHVLFKLTGVGFSPDVYYFDAIPTSVEPQTVLIVNAGAVAIAVAFSVWPAIRAAWMRPVKALRYE
jgi:lipoprotein-releasing system permease protein